MSCTTDILNIGCFGSCGTFETNLPLSEGSYTLEIHGDVVRQISFTHSGGNLQIDTSLFPINRETIFRLIDNDDNEYKSINDFSTFQLKTLVMFTGVVVDKTSWQETFEGGTDTFTPEQTLLEGDNIIIVVDGIVYQRDQTLLLSNSYKFDEGDIVTDTELGEDSYLTIIKIS